MKNRLFSVIIIILIAVICVVSYFLFFSKTSVTSVLLDKNDIKIIVGESVKLEATVYPSDASNKNVTWESSDINVASVSSSGLVKGINKGVAIITVISENSDIRDTCSIKVVNKSVENIILQKSEFNLEIGEIDSIQATIVPSDATSKKLIYKSSDESIVEVDDFGKIEAKDNGEADIIVTDEESLVTVKCKVKVGKPITKLVLDKKELSLGIDEEVSLNVSITPLDATDKTLSWTSSDSSIVSVSDNGKVKGKQSGEAIIKFKYFEVDFFLTTHSIPDSHGIRVKTPNGVVVTTGDFKFDLTPIGPMADLHKMARIGEEGVDLLISDSTNALNEGVSNSESKVDGVINDIFAKHKFERIIIATFASNIYRLKHIVETCYKYKRKICIFGRSMENNIDISIKGGYINHSELFINPDEANSLKPNEVCILCTGSQGEPLAALSRIADGEHKSIKLRPDDVVIFSSSPIPGNAVSIGKTINKLYLRGVKVYTNSDTSDIHTSGHANMEELKLMIRLIKPKYMLPFHGEYRMLKNHADISTMCGVDKDKFFILDNGDTLLIKNHIITKGDKIKQEEVYVDGNNASEIATQVIRDRKIMAGDGILVIIANIDMKNKKLLIKPTITTRGFVQVNKNEELLKLIEVKCSILIMEKLKENNVTFTDIKGTLALQISSYINELTGRHPIILPIILDIKK